MNESGRITGKKREENMAKKNKKRKKKTSRRKQGVICACYHVFVLLGPNINVKRVRSRRSRIID